MHNGDQVIGLDIDRSEDALCAEFPQRRNVMVVAGAAGFGKSAFIARLKSRLRDRYWFEEIPPALLDNRWRDRLTRLEATGTPGILIFDPVDSRLSDHDRHQLRCLVQLPPDNIGMVIATRDERHIPLTQARLGDRLLMVGPRHLRLSEELVAHMIGPRIERSAAAAYAKRLRRLAAGWPALTRLLLLDAGDLSGTDPAALVTRRRSELTEFLEDEILADLPEAEAALLRTTSILPVLEAEVCNRLCGHRQSRSLLVSLQRKGILELVHGYEDRFALPDALRYALIESCGSADGAEAAVRARLAVAHFIESNRARDALLVAKEADDQSLLISVIENLGWDLLSCEGPSELLASIDRLPERLVEANPKMSTLRAWCHVFVGQVEKVSRFLRMSHERSPPGDDFFKANRQALRRAAAALNDTSVDDLFPSEIAHVASVEFPFLKSLTLMHLGGVRRAQGDLRGSVAILKDCIMLADRAGAPFVSRSAKIALGQAYHMLGLLDDAGKTLRDALNARIEKEHDPVLYALCRIRIAQICYDQSKLDEVKLELEEAGHWVDENNGPRAYGLMLLELAKLSASHRDYATTEKLLDEARCVALAHDSARLLFLAQLQKCLVFMELAQPDAAEAVLADIEASLVRQASPVAPDKIERIGLCRAHLSATREHWESIDELSAEGLISAHRSGRMAHLALGETLCAVGWFKRGSHARAMDLFEPLLMKSRQENFQQIYVDLARSLPILPLLKLVRDKWSRIFALDSDVSWVNSLISRIDCGEDVRTFSAAGAVPMTLRKGEIRIIFLLSRGLTNKEIASHVSLSYETVKWHLKNIYSKLDARNRSEAIHKAKLLNII